MGIRIQQAERRDRELVVSVMEEAFHDDPVSSWVFPTRRTGARCTGSSSASSSTSPSTRAVSTSPRTEAAVALWLQVPTGAPEEEDPTPALMRETADPDNERCELVGRLTGAVHPHERAHAYLLMIGVRPAVRVRASGRS